MKKTIKMASSDNPRATIGFDVVAVSQHPNKESFIKAAKAAGHFEGSPEQEQLLTAVYDQATPKKAEPAKQ